MATNKNITMKQYNGLDYDTLYPKTTPEQVGAVSYEAQTLTDDQKTQARGNIGAAPAGYGLGENIGKTVNDANMAVLSGWYYHYGVTNAPYHGTTPLGYGMILVSAKYGYVWQTYFANTAGKHVKLQRYSTDGGSTWTEWEYENPPMELGVEYRTTERYLSKPVYTQIVQFDNLSTDQSFSPGGEIFRAIGEYQYPDTSGKYVPNMPTRILGETMTMDSPYMDFSDTYNRTLRVQLKSDSKCLGKSARVQIWYTK